MLPVEDPFYAVIRFCCAGGMENQESGQEAAISTLSLRGLTSLCPLAILRTVGMVAASCRDVFGSPEPYLLLCHTLSQSCGPLQGSALHGRGSGRVCVQLSLRLDPITPRAPKPVFILPTTDWQMPVRVDRSKLDVRGTVRGTKRRESRVESSIAQQEKLPSIRDDRERLASFSLNAKDAGDAVAGSWSVACVSATYISSWTSICYQEDKAVPFLLVTWR